MSLLIQTIRPPLALAVGTIQFLSAEAVFAAFPALQGSYHGGGIKERLLPFSVPATAGFGFVTGFGWKRVIVKRRIHF
jgi:hypothetical protein